MCRLAWPTAVHAGLRACRTALDDEQDALAPGRPGVLCVEEPENGLTPKATRVFYKTIRELAVGEHRAQVLMSSHSPFVITDAWNGGERNFIYQCSPVDGVAKTVKFSKAIEGAGPLKADGTIGLNLAERVMDGYLYEPE